jgi:hypothetical protein
MWKHRSRNMCTAHDIMGALTLVVSDVTWELIPANLTNPINVAAGQPPVYRARPNLDMPAPHAGNAASGGVNLHRMLMSKYNGFSFASSTLNNALLLSIGEVNQNILRTSNHVPRTQVVYAHPASNCGHHAGPARRSNR